MGNEAVGGSYETPMKNAKEIVKNTQKRWTPRFLDPTDQVQAKLSPEQRWRENLVASLKNHRGMVDDQEMYQGLLEVVGSIKEDSFVKAISVLYSMTQRKKGVLAKPFLKSCAPFSQSENETKLGLASQDTTAPSSDSKMQAKKQEMYLLESTTTASGLSTPDKGVPNNSMVLRRNLFQVLKKELAKEYHPIQHIKESFMMILKMKYRTILDTKTDGSKVADQNLLCSIRNDLSFYCSFITEGCHIYRAWIVKEAGIRQSRYKSYIRKIILESLFKDQATHQTLTSLLREAFSAKLAPLIARLPNHMSIRQFQINPELSIEGHFNNSLMIFSDLDHVTNPSECLDILQRVKTEMCYDIDLYHRAFNNTGSHKIDGDNLLGILCFMICKMKPKMEQIYAQLNLLSVLYDGEDGSEDFGEGMYVLTSLSAAFQYLMSEDFLNRL